jgi:hypothetical protein
MLAGEPQLGRLDACLRACMDTELAQNRRNVVVDRLLGDDEPLGDLRVAQALREELENLELAPGQAGGILPRGGAWAARKPAHASLAQPAGDDPSRRLRAQPAQVVECVAQRAFVVGFGQRERALIRRLGPAPEFGSLAPITSELGPPGLGYWIDGLVRDSRPATPACELTDNPGRLSAHREIERRLRRSRNGVMPPLEPGSLGSRSRSRLDSLQLSGRLGQLPSLVER